MLRWFLAAVVLVWLLSGAAWGALHGLIVPRIGEFRPQLEALATKTLGVPKCATAFVGKCSGLISSLGISDALLSLLCVEVTLLPFQLRLYPLQSRKHGYENCVYSNGVHRQCANQCATSG